mgnify:CR=1 FL=1
MTSDEPRRGKSSVVARVVELLPRATYRVETEHRQLVLAHAAAATQRNFVRLRPGDRVRVELSPHDPTRGRITELLAPGEGPC